MTNNASMCQYLLKFVTDKLQQVLNAAARLVSKTKKFDRCLSRLLHTDLHWLDVLEQVQFKVRMTVCRIDVCRTKLLSIWRNTAYHSETLTVDTFFLCHVIVELLAVQPSLLLVRWRGTLPDDLHNPSCYDCYFGDFIKSFLFSFY